MRFVQAAVFVVLAWASSALAGGGAIFDDADTYPAGDGETFRVTSGDFNRDGKPDLAATNLETPFFTVSVFLGKGKNGKFTDGEPFIGGGDNADVESGRFGKDRQPDLAVTDGDNNTVEVFRGNGDGSFDFAGFDSYPVGSSVFGIDVAKLPGDKWPDIVTANSSGGSVSVLYGKRNGTFEDAISLDTGDNDDDVIVTDLNRDGVPDIASSDFSDQVGVLIGKPGGTYKETDLYPVEEGPNAIAAGDLNGDKRPDLAVSNRTSGDVAVLLAKRKGFKPAEYFPLTGENLGHSRIAIADLDSDGKRDVAVAFDAAAGLTVMRGRGDGRLRSPLTFEGGAGPTGLVLGNFRKGDGIDAATANSEGDSVSVYLNR
ncbi:MAG: VCBS repeat-containing protein [Solirubrobacterales bacterium]